MIKLLWLAIRDIEDKRARQRAKERGMPPNERKAPGRLVEGAVVHGWKPALGALALAYPDRLAGLHQLTTDEIDLHRKLDRLWRRRGKAAAGRNLDVHVTDRVLQVWDGNQLLETVARSSRGEVRKKRASVPMTEV